MNVMVKNNVKKGESKVVLIDFEFVMRNYRAFDIHNMLCFMDEEDDKDPLNLVGLNKLFDEFVYQYTKLGLEDPL